VIGYYAGNKDNHKSYTRGILYTRVLEVTPDALREVQ
jgi:hypothetical protein